MRSLLAAMLVFTCGCAATDPPPDVSGSWSGTFTYKNDLTGEMTMDVHQADADLTGTWTQTLEGGSKGGELQGSARDKESVAVEIRGGSEKICSLHADLRLRGIFLVGSFHGVGCTGSVFGTIALQHQ